MLKSSRGFYKIRFDNGLKHTDKIVSVSDEGEVPTVLGGATASSSPIPELNPVAPVRIPDLDWLRNIPAAEAATGVLVWSSSSDALDQFSLVRPDGERAHRTLGGESWSFFLNDRQHPLTFQNVAGRRWSLQLSPLPSDQLFAYVWIEEASGRVVIRDLAVSGANSHSIEELTLLETARWQLASGGVFDSFPLTSWIQDREYECDPMLLLFALHLQQDERTPVGWLRRLHDAAESRFGASPDVWVAGSAREDRSIAGGRHWPEPPMLYTSWLKLVSHTARDPYLIPLGSQADRLSLAFAPKGVWAGYDPDRAGHDATINAINLSAPKIEEVLTSLAGPLLDRVGGTARLLSEPEEGERVLSNMKRDWQLTDAESWLLRFAVRVSIATTVLKDAYLETVGLHRADLLGDLIQESKLPAAHIWRVLFSLQDKLAKMHSGGGA